MPKPVDRVQISSAADLLQHFADIGAALEEPETEDSWQRLDKALGRLEMVTKSGGYKFDEFVPQLKAIAAPIRNSLLSDRTKLSGSAADLLNSVAPRLGERFDGLVSAFVPSLLLLCARTNKVALTRAKKCLLLIVKHCRLVSLLPLLRDAAKDKAPTLRVVAVECATGLVEVLEPARIGKRVADIEATIKGSATDANPEVRQWCKKLFELYVGAWPERVENFTAAFTPTSRRYLSLPKTGGLRPAAQPAQPKAQEAEASTSGQQRRALDVPMAESEMVRPSRAAEPEQAHRPRAPAAAAHPSMGAIRVQAAPSRVDMMPPNFHVPAPASMSAAVDPRLALSRSLSSSHGASGAPGMAKSSFSLASGLKIGNNALMASYAPAQGSRSRTHSAAAKVQDVEKAHREKRTEPVAQPAQHSGSSRREHAPEHHRSADRGEHRSREGEDGSRSGRRQEHGAASRTVHASAAEHVADSAAPPPSERLFARLAEVAGQSSSSSDGHHGEFKPRHHVKASRVIVPAPVIAPPPTISRHPSATRVAKTLPKGASAERLEALGEQGTPTAASKTPAADLCEGLEPSPLAFPAPITLQHEEPREAEGRVGEGEQQGEVTETPTKTEPEAAMTEAPIAEAVEPIAPELAAPLASIEVKPTPAAGASEKIMEPTEPSKDSDSTKPLNIVKKTPVSASSAPKPAEVTKTGSATTRARPGAAQVKPAGKLASSITKTMGAKSSLVGPSAAIAARLKRAAVPNAPTAARHVASLTSSSASARPVPKPPVPSAAPSKAAQSSSTSVKKAATASTVSKPTASTMSKAAPPTEMARSRAPISSSAKPVATKAAPASSRAATSSTTADARKTTATTRSERITKPPVPKASSNAASSSRVAAKVPTAAAGAAARSRPAVAPSTTKPSTLRQAAAQQHQHAPKPEPEPKGKAGVEKLKAALEETHGKEALTLPAQPQQAEEEEVRTKEEQAQQQPEEDVFGATTGIGEPSRVEKEVEMVPTATVAVDEAVVEEAPLSQSEAHAIAQAQESEVPRQQSEEDNADAEVAEVPVEVEAALQVESSGDDGHDVAEEELVEAVQEAVQDAGEPVPAATKAEAEPEPEAEAGAETIVADVEEMQSAHDEAVPDAVVEAEQTAAATPTNAEDEKPQTVEEAEQGLAVELAEQPTAAHGEATQGVAHDVKDTIEDAEQAPAAAPAIEAPLPVLEAESVPLPNQAEASVLLSPPAVDEQLQDVELPQMEGITEAEEEQEQVALAVVDEADMTPAKSIEDITPSQATPVTSDTPTPEAASTPTVTPSKRSFSKVSTPLAAGRSPRSRPVSPTKSIAPSSPVPRSPLAPINGRTSRPPSPLKRGGSPLKHGYVATPPRSTPIASAHPSPSPAPFEAAPSPASIAFGDDEMEGEEYGYDEEEDDEEELPDDSVAQIATSSPVKVQSSPLRIDRSRLARAATAQLHQRQQQKGRGRSSRPSLLAAGQQSFSDELTASSGDEEEEEEEEEGEDDDKCKTDDAGTAAAQARLVRSATGFQLICGAAQ